MMKWAAPSGPFSFLWEAGTRSREDAKRREKEVEGRARREPAGKKESLKVGVKTGRGKGQYEARRASLFILGKTRTGDCSFLTNFPTNAVEFSLRSSPNSTDAVLVEYQIGANQRHILNERLRGQQSVKGIAMMPQQCRLMIGVFQTDRQHGQGKVRHGFVHPSPVRQGQWEPT